jgi:hypothetical protein
MTVSPTHLRENLYNLLDQVLETQKPIEILRKGQIIKLSVEQKKGHKKLANLEAHPNALCDDPESYVQIDWSSHWQDGHDL